MRRASGIILFCREGEALLFLLLKNRIHGTWGFPKGLIQEGEDPLSAAFRELKEETGMEKSRVALYPHFEEVNRYSFLEEGKPVQKETVYFLGETIQRDIQPSQEHSRWIWGSSEEALSILQHESLKGVFRKALRTARDAASKKTITPEEAEDLLIRSSPPGERCVSHSLKVAEVARRMAENLKRKGISVNLDFVYAAAVLHDIGRARTQGSFHGWEGYLFLREKGLDDLGRFCITHWLKGRSRKEIERDGKIPGEILDEIEERIGLGEMILEDKIISLADSLVMEDQEVDLKTRYKEASRRYGNSSWIQRNLEISLRFKEEIEELLR